MSREQLKFAEADLRRFSKCFAAEGFECVEAELSPDGRLVIFGCRGEAPANQPQPVETEKGNSEWADAELP